MLDQPGDRPILARPVAPLEDDDDPPPGGDGVDLGLHQSQMKLVHQLVVGLAVVWRHGVPQAPWKCLTAAEAALGPSTAAARGPSTAR